MRYDTGRPRAVIRATQKAASFPWRKARASGPRQQARPQRPPCAKPQQHAQCPRPQARLPEVGLDDPPEVNNGGTRDQVDEAVLLLPAFAKPPDHGATRTGAPTMMHYQPFIDDPAHLETLFVLPLDLEREVPFVSHLRDLVKLRLEPVDMLLLVLEERREQLA